MIKMNRHLTFYTILFFIIISIASQAQEVELVASVSKNKLGVNQRFKIEYSINKQGADNFRPPNFTNFKIVGGPSQSISQSWINGKMSFSKSYTYILQPKRKGEFNLPSASIEFEDKMIKSKKNTNTD